MTKIKDFVAFKKSGGLTELSTAIKTALASVEKQYGIVITPSKWNYSNGYADLKLIASVVGDNGEVATRDSEEFKISAELYGLQPSDLYKEFTAQGHQFKIIGVNGGRKLPICLLDIQSGKKYGMSAQAVRVALNVPNPKFAKVN